MALTGDFRSYIPQAKQIEFHNSLARLRQFKAANRGGKTVAGGGEAVWVAMGAHPHRSGKRIPVPNNGWIISPDFNVSQTVAEPLVRQMLPRELIVHDDARERSITLLNGSRITFKSADQGREKFQGASCHWIWFDEEPPEDIYKEGLLRTADVRGDIWITMTPLKGENWTYDQIYVPWLEGDVHMDDRGFPDIDVIEGTIWDNAYVARDEIERMTRGLAEHEKASRLMGDYASGEGQVFPEWNPLFHVPRSLDCLPGDGAIEGWWEQSIGMDHGAGYGHTAAYHLARRDDGVIACTTEYYEERGIGAREHARQFVITFARYSNPSRPVMVWLDPAARQFAIDFAQALSALPLGDGFAICKANNDRKRGYSRMHDALYVDAEGRTGLVVYPDCKRLQRDIPRHVFKETEAGEANDAVKKKNSHSLDALRYGLMGLPDKNIERARVGAPTDEEQLEDYLKRLIGEKMVKEQPEDYGEDGLG